MGLLSAAARNLHRIAGMLDRLRREALTGRCAYAGCTRPATGWTENCVTLRPAGICDDHTTTATRLGYVVHHSLED